jgi:hypothetical protein
MGIAGNAAQNSRFTEATPALRGRRKEENSMFSDPSRQQIGSSAVTPRTNSPSTPAMNSGGHPGETTGEIIFKRRLAALRAKQTQRNALARSAGAPAPNR